MSEETDEKTGCKGRQTCKRGALGKGSLAIEKKVSLTLIDAETMNAALSLRAKAEAIEPGFDARAYLEALGL